MMEMARKGKREKTRELKGYLTVYTALTLTVMISLCLTLVEGVRRNTVAFEAECIMDIGMNSVLAEYHRELLKRYGLLMVDTSYGTNYPSYYNTEQHLSAYLARNLDYSDSTKLSFLYRDLLGMELEDVQVQKVSLATDDGGKVFQYRAAECMQSRLGLEGVSQLFTWMETVEEYQLLERNIGEEMDQVSEDLQQYGEMNPKIAQEDWILIDPTDPLDSLGKMRREGILKWVVEDVSLLSTVVINQDAYVSARAARGEINHGNYPEREPLELIDNILLLEYFMSYAGYYGNARDDSLLQYQIEYLLCGNAADRDNLKRVADMFCCIRGASNLAYLMSCAEKKAEAEAVAAIASELITLPELEPVFETALLLTWAYLESLYDVRLLFSGGRVPLMKTDADWHYSLTNIWKPQINTGEVGGTGLSYGDYLRIFLYVQPPDTLSMRFMDLMEMDIQRTLGNSCFRMDGCIDGLEAEACIHSGYGYSFSVTRQKNY